MKVLTHPAMTALGITTLCLMSELAALISPSHLQIYHLSETWMTAFAPVVFNVVLLWLILFGLLRLVEWRSERTIALVWSGLLLFLPGVLLETFTTGGSSYINNLALADRYLAHVHDLLEQRGEWNFLHGGRDGRSFLAHAITVERHVGVERRG